MRRCSLLISFGDLGMNFRTFWRAGPGALARIRSPSTVPDDAGRRRLLMRRRTGEDRSSVTYVSDPVRSATDVNTAAIVRMRLIWIMGGSSVLDVDDLADDERPDHLEHDSAYDHLNAERVAKHR